MPSTDGNLNKYFPHPKLLMWNDKVHLLLWRSTQFLLTHWDQFRKWKQVTFKSQVLLKSLYRYLTSFSLVVAKNNIKKSLFISWQHRYHSSKKIRSKEGLEGFYVENMISLPCLLPTLSREKRVNTAQWETHPPSFSLTSSSSKTTLYSYLHGIFEL